LYILFSILKLLFFGKIFSQKNQIKLHLLNLFCPHTFLLFTSATLSLHTSHLKFCS